MSGFRFAYHPSVRDRVRPLLAEAPRLRADAASRLGQPVLASVEVRVAVNGVDLERVVPTDAVQGKDASIDRANGLVAFSLSDDADASRSSAIARSALGELALLEATGGAVAPWFRIGFVGGFAEPASFARRRIWWSAAMAGLNPSLADVDARLRLEARTGDVPEAMSVDAVDFLERSPNDFRRLVSACRSGTSFEAALADSYGLDAPSLEQRLVTDLRRHRAATWVGLVALVAWLASFGFQLVRKRRRARAAECAAAREALVPKVRFVTPLPTRRARVTPGPREPLDPDVPMVSHDGDWHTLH